MHIPDGILPISVAAGGYVAAAALTGVSLKAIERRYPDPRTGIPRAALLAATFFAGSLVHIPLPPVSVHLVLSGLMGVILGWFAVPAILVGLLLQALMFQHGGITMLGVNTCVIAGPALLAAAIFRSRVRFGLTGRAPAAVFGFIASLTAVVTGAAGAALLIVTTVPAYLDAAVERGAVTALLLAHVPLGVIEGVITALVVLFLLKVQPAMLEERV